MIRLVCTLTLLLLLVVAPARAGFGLGAGLAAPTGDFDNGFATGFGLHALAEVPLTKALALTADGAWYRFSTRQLASDVPDLGDLGNGGDSLDIWSVAGGAEVRLGLVGLGVEYGVFGEIEDAGFMPNVSLDLEPMEFMVRFKLGDGFHWVEGRLGFFF